MEFENNPFIGTGAFKLHSFDPQGNWTFQYNDFSISREQARAGETIEIKVKVTNTGPVVGDEVAQLYIHDEYASVPRPVKELKGYARLTLMPGEAKTITFSLAVNQLAFYDQDLALVVESGNYQVMVGSSSADIRCEGGFRVEGPKKTPVCEPVYTCPVIVK